MEIDVRAKRCIQGAPKRIGYASTFRIRHVPEAYQSGPGAAKTFLIKYVIGLKEVDGDPNREYICRFLIRYVLIKLN